MRSPASSGTLADPNCSASRGSSTVLPHRRRTGGPALSSSGGETRCTGSMNGANDISRIGLLRTDVTVCDVIVSLRNEITEVLHHGVLNVMLVDGTSMCIAGRRTVLILIRFPSCVNGGLHAIMDPRGRQ